MRSSHYILSILINKIGVVFLFLYLSIAIISGCGFENEDKLLEDDIWDRYVVETNVIQRTGNINYSDSTVVAISIFDFPDYKLSEDHNMMLIPVRNAAIIFDNTFIEFQENDLHLAFYGDYSDLIIPQLNGGSKHTLAISIKEWGTTSRTIQVPQFIDLYGLPAGSTFEIGDTLFLSIGEHPDDESVFLRSNYYDDDRFYIGLFDNDSLTWIIPDDIQDTLKLDLLSGISEPSEIIEIINNQSLRYSYYGGCEQRYELHLNDNLR